MLYSYPGCFFQRPDGKLCLVFPDLNNLAIFGDDFNGTLSKGINLLAKYLFNMQLKKEVAPVPSNIDTIKPKLSEEYSRAFIKIVTVEVDEYSKTHFEREVKKSVSLPQWLYDLAVKESIDISKLTKKALYKELGIDEMARKKMIEIKQ